MESNPDDMAFQVWKQSREVLAEAEGRLVAALDEYARKKASYPRDLASSVVELRRLTDRLLDRACAELRQRSQVLARSRASTRAEPGGPRPEGTTFGGVDGKTGAADP